MSDQQISCSECGGVFVFTEAEQDFYASTGLAAPPKRCKACGQARRAAREGGGGGRDSRSFGRPQTRRFSNAASEYRSPMSGAPGGGAGGHDGYNARAPRGNRNDRNDRNGPPRSGNSFRPAGDR